MKILIVEDNPDDRLLLKINLEARGCDVIEAANGIEGLALAKEHKPVLVISDGLMPGMDGFQLLRKVRQDKELQSLPFVFYSATYSGDAEVALGLSLGADAYIIKPKEPDVFWEEILKILDACELRKGVVRGETALRDEEYLQRYTNIVTTKLEEKIKELEKSRDCVEESRKQYKKLFDSTLDGVYSTDENNRFVQLNNAFARLLGFARPEELIGRSSLAFWVDAGDRDEYVRKLKEKKGLGAYPVRGRKKDGSDLYLEISSTILEDENGRFMGIEGIARDTTERRKLENQLRQAQKMEAIGLLAGGVAHDFNNILSAIIGYGNVALMKMADDDPQRMNIEHMLEAADRAAHLTKDLLLFSRKQVSERRAVDLNDIVRKVEKFLRRVIGEDVECKTILHNAPIAVSADSHQIEQVLMNLATNARDAMSRGGAFTVATEQVLLDGEFVAAHGYGGTGAYALMTVSDAGAGMDEETRTHIFEPFFTTKEVGKGTGLGLAVVYGIIKQHDGFINVYSEPGKGTTFRIYLPMVAREAVEKTVPPPEEAPARGTETVLLAEDDEALRKLTRTVLADYGYTVLVAVDGEDAVNKFKEHKDRIQLLLFDLIMPKKNGKEAYDEIRKSKPDMKIIFASGYAPDIVRQKVSLEPDTHLVYKPLSPMALLRKVRSVLDGTAR